MLTASIAVTASVVASCLIASPSPQKLALACTQGVTSRVVSYRSSDLAGGVTEWTPIDGVVSFAPDTRPVLVPVLSSYTPVAGTGASVDVVRATVLF